MAISSSDKLALYNGALTRLGERRLASLTEAREPRRVLDDIWGASDNAPRWCLERGEWNFAIKTVLADYDSGIEPDFGFRRAYPKPSDCIRLAAMSSDEYFTETLTDDQFSDEAGYWFTDLDNIYIRYVSDDGAYGFRSSAWPEAFRNLLESYLAERAARRIGNSASLKQEQKSDKKDALTEAKSGDAMNEGVKMLPHGGWARSRGRWMDRNRTGQ